MVVKVDDNSKRTNGAHERVSWTRPGGCVWLCVRGHFSLTLSETCAYLSHHRGGSTHHGTGADLLIVEEGHQAHLRVRREGRILHRGKQGLHAGEGHHEVVQAGRKNELLVGTADSTALYKAQHGHQPNPPKP